MKDQLHRFWKLLRSRLMRQPKIFAQGTIVDILCVGRDHPVDRILPCCFDILHTQIKQQRTP